MSKGTNIKLVCHSANLRLIVRQYEMDTDEMTPAERRSAFVPTLAKLFRIAK